MATAKKQFSSIKLQQQKLKQQLQREVVENEQRIRTQQSQIQQQSASVSGNSLIKLYYKQNAISSQQKTTSSTRHPNFANYSGNNSNHYIFKTTNQKPKKDNNSLRKVSNDNFPNTLQLQMSNASLNGMMLQKSGSRAFLKTTIDSMKSTYGYQDKQHLSKQIMPNYSIDQNPKQQQKTSMMNNFIFDYDKSQNDLLMYTYQNGNSMKGINNSNLTNNKADSQSKSITRNESKSQLNSIAKQARIQQVQSMKKLTTHQNNDYMLQVEDKKMTREQSCGSLSRQKSQAKLQTFSQIANKKQNQLSQQNEHGGQSQDKEAANSYHQSSQQRNCYHHKNPAIALSNCTSKNNIIYASGLNLQNLKHIVPQNFCVSPSKNTIDSCFEMTHDQQQSKKLMRTGPVKIMRRDNDIVEQQSSQQQQYGQQKENIIYNNNNTQSTNGGNNPTMSKKEAGHKVVNLDKLRDLLRGSSKERRQDVAKQVKDNKQEILTRTHSLLNFKQKQLQDHFEIPDGRFTPIQSEIYHNNDPVDDTNDDIKGLLLSLNRKIQ